MARWAALIYPKHYDRESALTEVLRALERRQVQLAGFVQRTRHDGEREVVDLVRLGRSERRLLGIPRGQAASADGCSFWFDPETFAAGQRWLEEDAPQAQVLVTDEISRLELVGRGHHASLRWALARPDPATVLFCTRADRLADAVTAFAPRGEPLAWLELSAGAPFDASAFASALNCAG